MDVVLEKAPDLLTSTIRLSARHRLESGVGVHSPDHYVEILAAECAVERKDEILRFTQGVRQASSRAAVQRPRTPPNYDGHRSVVEITQIEIVDGGSDG